MELFLISHPASCFRSHSPISLGDSWEETMGTQPCGCRWSSASRPPFWCTSTTITCSIMGARQRASRYDAAISAITEMLNVKNNAYIFRREIFKRLQPKSNVIISQKARGRWADMFYHVQCNQIKHCRAKAARHRNAFSLMFRTWHFPTDQFRDTQNQKCQKYGVFIFPNAFQMDTHLCLQFKCSVFYYLCCCFSVWLIESVSLCTLFKNAWRSSTF